MIGGIGGMIGMTIVARGRGCVVWAEPIPDCRFNHDFSKLIGATDDDVLRAQYMMQTRRASEAELRLATRRHHVEMHLARVVESARLIARTHVNGLGVTHRLDVNDAEEAPRGVSYSRKYQTLWLLQQSRRHLCLLH